MPEIPEQLFLDVVHKAVGKNLEFVPPYHTNASNGSLYIRPLLFGSGESLILGSPETFTFLVWVTPTGALYSNGKVVPAVDAFVIEKFDRAAPMGTGSVKLAGNYAPTFIHSAEAKKAGYAITLHLDSKTRENIDGMCPLVRLCEFFLTFSFWDNDRIFDVEFPCDCRWFADDPRCSYFTFYFEVHHDGEYYYHRRI